MLRQDDAWSGSGDATKMQEGASDRSLAWARLVILPALEALADVAADPADLIAAADRQARALRRDLEGPLPAAHEAEREWFRGHLHDTVLQVLEFIAGDGLATGLSPSQIAELAAGAARDLRRWTDADAEIDLFAELHVLIDETRALQADLDVALQLDEALDFVPVRGHAGALLGAVREALNNARKHARATQVIVRVESTPGGLTVTVTDDGIGTDPDRVSDAAGLGIRHSIAGRMQRVGGRASLSRAPGGGTRVTLVGPARPTVDGLPR